MRNFILTLSLLGSTLAGVSSAAPASIVKVQDSGDVLGYSELYTESAWQTILVDGAGIGLPSGNDVDVTGQLELTSDAPSGVNVSLDSATLGAGLALGVTVTRADTSVAVNRPVTFTLKNTATGQSMTFMLPVVGTAEQDTSLIQTVWADE
ncbi:hypothetical protein [Deinococcus maricopensis]|uniref:Uncharacterized protein n=1 Tax=Deinococcus maricopensis (strain DSM 21211 / LMG 22137 / NRRL B-23946 / LB-34) TaxID=709986 RepID=E8U4E9_DEIML|nr:hypothetical protein [Deinococcus maricopensis]ADV68814.1 hypothetical protein Deima_3186 [Deinococcus maricopensis DSM 21211]